MAAGARHRVPGRIPKQREAWRDEVVQPPTARCRIYKLLVNGILTTNAIIGPRHDDEMDRAETEALPLDFGADDEPEHVEGNRFDLGIIESVKRVDRAARGGSAERP
jgi:hypothetical protein